MVYEEAGIQGKLVVIQYFTPSFYNYLMISRKLINLIKLDNKGTY